MLSIEQQIKLAGALAATAEAMGCELSANAIEIMVEDLADYPEESIAAALKACRRYSKGKLTAGEILERIEAIDGHPGPDEAWAIALRAVDETDSIMLTDEIRQAILDARSVIASRDKVAARRSFIASYERYVNAARESRKPPRWELSLGHDPQLRLQAIEDATRRGLLPPPKARQLTELLSGANHPASRDGLAIAGLITGKPVEPSQELHKRFNGLREQLRQAGPEERRRLAEEARRFLLQLDGEGHAHIGLQGDCHA